MVVQLELSIDLTALMLPNLLGPNRLTFPASSIKVGLPWKSNFFQPLSQAGDDVVG
jgi:hypothetical protein